MMKRTGRKLILWLAALALLVTSCATAFASPGDRTIKHTSSMNYFSAESVEAVFRSGDGFSAMITGDMGEKTLLKYADLNSEPEEYKIPGYEAYDPWAAMEEDAAIAAAEAAEQAFSAGEAPEGAEPAAETGAEAAALEAAEPEAAEAPAIGGLLNWDDIDWSDDEPDLSAALPDAADWDGEEFNYEPEPYINNWFAWNGELYGIGVIETYNDAIGQSHVEGIKIRHAVPQNGEIIVEDCDLPEWDHERVMEYLDLDGYFYLESAFTVGDLLIARNWNQGAVINLKTGECTQLETGDFPSGMTAGPEGSVLMAAYDYSTQKNTIIRKNLTDGKEEVIAELENGSDSMGLAYDPDTDTVYMARNGEVWKSSLADIAGAVAVNDSPLAECNIVPLADGYVLLWNRNNILVRNTDPAVRGGITLYVEDNTGYNDTMSEAAFSMSEKRGDVSVAVRRQYSWAAQGTVLEDMLNRDGRTDIYVLPYDGNNFNALKKRGYLADLSDNAEIAEGVSRMYPYIQDAMKADGKIIGIPIAIAGSTYGLDFDMWKKLGGTEEELPKTWDQFFSWLEKLPERLEGTEISLFDDPYAGSLSDMFFSKMVEQYQLLMESKGEELVFNAPLLTDLVKKAASVDFRDLGLKTWEEMMADGGSYSYNEKSLLSASAVMPTLGDRFYEGLKAPLPLSFTEGEDPIIPVRIFVACVNPYSEHAAEAKEFLALVLGKLDTEAEYSFFADKTEPLRYPGYEEDKKRAEGWVEQARRMYEKAEEGIEKINAESYLKDEEEYLKQMEESHWRIYPAQIENYQKNLPFYKVLDHDVYEEIQSTISEEEALQMSRNMGDNADYEAFLSFIDSKLQMIRMEGK